MDIHEIEKKIEKDGFIIIGDLKPSVISTLVKMGYKYYNCKNVKLKIDSEPINIRAIGKPSSDWDSCYEWYKKKMS